MTPPATDPAGGVTTVLVGGHESAGGRRLLPWVVGGHAFRAVGTGRELADAVEEALARSGGPVCVVPATLGRDPRLIADTARALGWLACSTAPGRIALTEPFGTAAHLVGWLRAAAARDQRVGAGSAMLVTAPAAGPFDDAELFRIARLVRQYGRHRWVEVAFDGGDPGPGAGVDRCRRLGADRVLLVPAAFGPPTPETWAGAESSGSLLTPQAAAGVLRARVNAALHRLGHGDDGIAAGLDAEHGHGLAHSHSHPHRHIHE
ncbi:sirohydrochlorin chelatase [Streptacidiphilus sp. P02-A3a]|uniref:sirohydrochlorin chelatase n=1 Tax=Streptacidiphilus sp. P02-A3a TaxID=2704468 RepID=UPI0015FB2A28|nr:hypothetical protein [Streptacidiphilus sp. P02-A3a]QMU68837.1 hypothetical protein GXP74_11955 [Streptacidiphilus sp. P02-A3a]